MRMASGEEENGKGGVPISRRIFPGRGQGLHLQRGEEDLTLWPPGRVCGAIDCPSGPGPWGSFGLVSPSSDRKTEAQRGRVFPGPHIPWTMTIVAGRARLDFLPPRTPSAHLREETMFSPFCPFHYLLSPPLLYSPFCPGCHCVFNRSVFRFCTFCFYLSSASIFLSSG